MKAVRVINPGSYEGLLLGDEAVPEPGRNEVLVRVHAASLNYRDIIIAKGLYPGAQKHQPVPLSDGAGEVVKVGANVTRARPGDRVTANCAVHWIGGPALAEYHSSSIGMTIDGMLAEYIVLHENALVLLPDYLSYAEAASLPCAAVSAWSALNLSTPLQPGQTVLVQGTGGVALFALQIARMFGARVLAITSSDQKADRLRELGAEHVINYKQVPGWDQEVLRITEGRGVDKVVEIGGETTIVKSVACTRSGGEIGLVGFVSGFGGGLPPIDILQRTVLVQGVAVGPRISFDALVAAMATTKVRPVVDRIFPFEDYISAYRHLESGQHVGKVVIGFPG
jgi:NADPH:quinone reductase-like Zn-dependent oxidoreductase